MGFNFADKAKAVKERAEASQETKKATAKNKKKVKKGGLAAAALLLVCGAAALDSAQLRIEVDAPDLKATSYTVQVTGTFENGGSIQRNVNVSVGKEVKLGDARAGEYEFALDPKQLVDGDRYYKLSNPKYSFDGKSDAVVTLQIVLDEETMKAAAEKRAAEAEAKKAEAEKREAEAAARKAAQEEERLNRTVYTTNSGSCYHTGTCSKVSKSKNETTIRAAEAQGYTACSICRPRL